MVMRAWFFSGLLSVVCGCAKSPVDTPVTIEQVPAEIMKIAKEQLPEVNFNQALRRSDGSFEIRGKDPQGKVRDVEFDAKGAVIEIE